MLVFLIRRLLGAIVVLAVVSVVVFVIFVKIPGGDPASRIAGRTASPESVERVRESFGFDKPWYVQYGRMMKQIFTAKLTSYISRQNVVHEIASGIPATFSLVIGAGMI